MHDARRSRKPCRRELADRQLLVEIEAARSGRRRVYGARKPWKELRRREVDAGRDQVARVMRARAGRQAARREEADNDPGRGRRRTRPRALAARLHGDPAEREVGRRPDLHPQLERLRLPRLHPRLHSRKIVGWQLARHMRAELVLDALEMANGLRRPEAGLIAHSDRGSQDASLTYTDRLDELEIAPSIGSKGDAYDNAMAKRGSRPSRTSSSTGDASRASSTSSTRPSNGLAYHDERLHEALGDLPPTEYEQLNITTDNTPMVAAT
jgi:transposase InsO family protein